MINTDTLPEEYIYTQLHVTSGLKIVYIRPIEPPCLQCVVYSLFTVLTIPLTTTKACIRTPSKPHLSVSSRVNNTLTKVASVAGGRHSERLYAVVVVKFIFMKLETILNSVVSQEQY